LDQLETQLYQAVKAAGVDADKDLRVSDLTSDYKSFLLKKNEGRATKEYVLKVDNEHLMSVFRELDKAGISNVNIQSSRYSKTQELYNELLGEAVATAKKRAEIMASGAGQSVKQMIYAQTYDNSAAYDAGMASNALMFNVSRTVMPEAAPTLEFNKIRIEVNVTTRFRLWYK
ncbi:MAG: SIMPL domain-containing protein, partial [Rikenellaceae bacterium]|nr:SIMPL domain-containing protein [Rikenellaceae bacterium]